MLVADATPPSYRAYLRARDIHYLVAGEQRVDLTTALTLFATDLGAEHVVVDGGSKLHHALLAAGLVDQVHVEIAPVILGTPGMTVFQVNGSGLAAGVTLIP